MLNQISFNSFRVLLLSLLVTPNLVLADLPQWSYQQMPFDLKLNMDAVYDVTHVSPENLAKTIEKYGVKIFVAPAPNAKTALNKHLKDLPKASAQLLEAVEWKPTYEGRAIVEELSCCNTGSRALVIREDASNYTLIHEFLHTMLTPSNGKSIPGSEFETRFDGQILRRFNFYQRKLYDDVFELGNPLWRRDIQSAQADFIEGLYERVRMGQAQEGIIEKVLQKYIDVKSPFYDKARAEQGYKYGELMINNAIDLFNSIHASISYTREAVEHLSVEFKNGKLKGANYKFNKGESELFVKRANELELLIGPIKNEILKLKSFYSK